VKRGELSGRRQVTGSIFYAPALRVDVPAVSFTVENWKELSISEY